MIRLAANVSFLFPELTFLERFKAAAAAGFRAVEWTFAYDFDLRDLAHELTTNGLDLVLLNTPPGSGAANEMGLAGLPGREREFDEAFDAAMAQATALDARFVHVLVGARPNGLDATRMDSTLIENLTRAAHKASDTGISLTLEPLNRHDRPTYHLHTVDHAIRLIREAGCPNIKLQLDLYHQQLDGGDIVRTLERVIGDLGHVQIAGAPNRTEPSRGELAYERVLDHLDSLGYRGFIGCEYTPSSAVTAEGLDWASRYLEQKQ